MTRSSLLVCAASLLAFGCPSTPGPHDLSHLTAADQFEVFSLDPKPETPPPRDAPEREGFFHGYPILGSVRVDAEADRKLLADALQEGLDRAPAQAAGCFWPRHGLRVVGKNVSADYVICFECLQIRIYADGKPDWAKTSSAPRTRFNDFLIAHGATVAPEN